MASVGKDTTLALDGNTTNFIYKKFDKTEDERT